MTGKKSIIQSQLVESAIAVDKQRYAHMHMQEGRRPKGTPIPRKRTHKAQGLKGNLTVRYTWRLRPMNTTTLTRKLVGALWLLSLAFTLWSTLSGSHLLHILYILPLPPAALARRLR